MDTNKTIQKTELLNFEKDLGSNSSEKNQWKEMKKYLILLEYEKFLIPYNSVC